MELVRGTHAHAKARQGFLPASDAEDVVSQEPRGEPLLPQEITLFRSQLGAIMLGLWNFAYFAFSIVII